MPQRLILCLLLSVFASKFHLLYAKGSRIVGGEAAPVGHFPFIAAIYVQTNDSRFFCGGALINAQWIITSGHCASNAELFTIQLGSTTLTLEDTQREIFSTSDYVLHPDFSPETLDNDIALIKLRMPTSYSTYIRPINLPSQGLENGTSVTAIGWGHLTDNNPELSEHLQMVTISTLSSIECRFFYGSQITDSMVCVIGNYNEGTCTGDTGSPLVEYFGRSYSIAGVASFISGNGCESVYPSGYTRTYPHISWIRNVTDS